jgi:hypothetical protein
MYTTSENVAYTLYFFSSEKEQHLLTPKDENEIEPHAVSEMQKFPNVAMAARTVRVAE